MKTFEYLGLTFKPVKQWRGRAASMKIAMSRMKDVGITPAGWNWNDFYKAAGEENGKIDVFSLNGEEVVPTGGYLARYNENKK